MLVANTSQVKQQLPEHVLSKSPGRRLTWSHVPEAGQKILNLYSRHTEVSFDLTYTVILDFLKD